MSELQRRLRGGFAFGQAWFPWGTLYGELLDAHPGGGRLGRRWLDLPCTNLAGIDVVDSSVHGVHRERPVLRATYALPPEVADDEGLARLRALLDNEVGPGQHETLTQLPGFPASGSVRASSDWMVDRIEISVSAYATVRDEAHGPSGGRLYIGPDLAPLALPYHEAFDAKSEPWSIEPGEIERIAVAGLEPTAELDDTSRQEFALRFPHLRRTPAWVAHDLSTGEVALWTHASGHWGLADAVVTICISAGAPVTFEHLRYLPARGPGGARLALAGAGPVVDSGPGPAGLDALVARLKEVEGVTVDSAEFPDA